MVETELKFRVPPESRAALQRAVAAATAARTRLRAVYFDTPGRHLAAAGMALRLRLEGRHWVQTLKGSAGLMARAEHEVRLPPQRGEPALDPQRHAQAPVGQALLALLATHGLSVADLQVLYRTDVMRLHRLLRHAGATFEIAYDRGQLMAGSAEAPRRLPVDELEIELKAGAPQALPVLAARWVARFGLWWDPRTKSEMGTRLALAQPLRPAVKAQAPAWDAATATPGTIWSAALQSALLQALANAAECIDGTGSAEHLHQLRVGLRRLRAALRLFAPWCADPAAAHALDDAWREPFGALGAARDADVRAQALAPRLAAAGAPPFDWPAPEAAPQDLDAWLRGTPLQQLLLRSLALSLAPAPAGSGSAGDAARECLRQAWRTIRRDARGFAAADAAARHRLRKRLKRLRYAFEFVGPLFPGKPARRLLAALARALGTLGELNDGELAAAVLRTQAQVQPAAWFAVGWLGARHEVQLEQAAAALAALAEAPRPWRRR